MVPTTDAAPPNSNMNLIIGASVGGASALALIIGAIVLGVSRRKRNDREKRSFYSGVVKNTSQDSINSQYPILLNEMGVLTKDKTNWTTVRDVGAACDQNVTYRKTMED